METQTAGLATFIWLEYASLASGPTCEDREYLRILARQSGISLQPLFIFLYVYGSFCLPVCVPGSLELELQRIVRCHVVVCEPRLLICEDWIGTMASRSLHR